MYNYESFFTDNDKIVLDKLLKKDSSVDTAEKSWLYEECFVLGWIMNLVDFPLQDRETEIDIAKEAKSATQQTTSKTLSNILPITDGFLSFVFSYSILMLSSFNPAFVSLSEYLTSTTTKKVNSAVNNTKTNAQSINW